MMCCFSCEADDRLEVASGMGQDCSCCGCFGQNRKFQSCLQVRKQTNKGLCWTFCRPYLTVSQILSHCKCTDQNQEYYNCREDINKIDIGTQLYTCFVSSHRLRGLVAELKMLMDITLHICFLIQFLCHQPYT